MHRDFVILLFSLVLLAVFIRTATERGDRALIDLRLFKGQAFSASVITQFMSNGISFAGQMLIPIYLIPRLWPFTQHDGLAAVPSWPGDDVHLPVDGNLDQAGFGIRNGPAGGRALHSLARCHFSTWQVTDWFLLLLASALFIRGAGLSAIGIPSISAAYASVERADLPMATTALNIVCSTPGGPTLTTLCARRFWDGN